MDLFSSSPSGASAATGYVDNFFIRYPELDVMYWTTPPTSPIVSSAHGVLDKTPQALIDITTENEAVSKCSGDAPAAQTPQSTSYLHENAASGQSGDALHDLAVHEDHHSKGAARIHQPDLGDPIVQALFRRFLETTSCAEEASTSSRQQALFHRALADGSIGRQVAPAFGSHGASLMAGSVEACKHPHGTKSAATGGVEPGQGVTQLLGASSAINLHTDNDPLGDVNPTSISAETSKIVQVFTDEAFNRRFNLCFEMELAGHIHESIDTDGDVSAHNVQGSDQLKVNTIPPATFSALASSCTNAVIPVVPAVAIDEGAWTTGGEPNKGQVSARVGEERGSKRPQLPDICLAMLFADQLIGHINFGVDRYWHITTNSWHTFADAVQHNMLPFDIIRYLHNGNLKLHLPSDPNYDPILVKSQSGSSARGYELLNLGKVNVRNLAYINQQGIIYPLLSLRVARALRKTSRDRLDSIYHNYVFANHVRPEADGAWQNGSSLQLQTHALDQPFTRGINTSQDLTRIYSVATDTFEATAAQAADSSNFAHESVIVEDLHFVTSPILQPDQSHLAESPHNPSHLNWQDESNTNELDNLFLLTEDDSAFEALDMPLELSRNQLTDDFAIHKPAPIENHDDMIFSHEGQETTPSASRHLFASTLSRFAPLDRLPGSTPLFPLTTVDLHQDFNYHQQNSSAAYNYGSPTLSNLPRAHEIPDHFVSRHDTPAPPIAMKSNRPHLRVTTPGQQYRMRKSHIPHDAQPNAFDLLSTASNDDMSRLKIFASNSPTMHGEPKTLDPRDIMRRKTTPVDVDQVSNRKRKINDDSALPHPKRKHVPKTPAIKPGSDTDIPTSLSTDPAADALFGELLLQEAPSDSRPVPPAVFPNLARVPPLAMPGLHPSSSKVISWSLAEDILCMQLMPHIKHTVNPKRVQDLWVLVAEQMLAHGYERSAQSIKNQWNRRLRAKSGFDERQTPRPDVLTTGGLGRDVLKVGRVSKKKET